MNKILLALHAMEVFQDGVYPGDKEATEDDRDQIQALVEAMKKKYREPRKGRYKDFMMARREARMVAMAFVLDEAVAKIQTIREQALKSLANEDTPDWVYSDGYAHGYETAMQNAIAIIEEFKKGGFDAIQNQSESNGDNADEKREDKDAGSGSSAGD